MRGRISLFLVLIYALVASPVLEIVKLPSLYEHYQEHKKEDKSLNLMDFFLLHYSSQHGEIDTKHSDLPFKVLKIIPQLIAIVQEKTVLPLSLAESVYSDRDISSYLKIYAYRMLSSIWQPPQI